MVKNRIPGKEMIWILATLVVTGLAVFMVIWFFESFELRVKYLILPLCGENFKGEWE